MTIEAGDLVLGDIDGVVSILRFDADDVLSRTRKKNGGETRRMEATMAGTIDRSRIDKALIEAGCEFVD